MKYSFWTKVEKVFKYQPIVRGEKSKEAGATPVFTTRDLGWFVKLHGSYEAICVGEEQPVMKAGDWVKITIEGENNATGKHPDEAPAAKVE